MHINVMHNTCQCTVQVSSHVVLHCFPPTLSSIYSIIEIHSARSRLKASRVRSAPRNAQPSSPARQTCPPASQQRRSARSRILMHVEGICIAPLSSTRVRTRMPAVVKPPIALCFVALCLKTKAAVAVVNAERHLVRLSMELASVHIWNK